MFSVNFSSVMSRWPDMRDFMTDNASVRKIAFFGFSPYNFMVSVAFRF